MPLSVTLLQFSSLRKINGPPRNAISYAHRRRGAAGGRAEYSLSDADDAKNIRSPFAE